MISHATGQPIRSRLSPAELRESEIRAEAAQGPVPACLQKGYEPPPVTVRTCARPALRTERVPRSRPGRPKLPPAPAKPLDDIEVRKTAVALQLADGAWRTAWEISRATGLHPEVVRTTLHSLRAVSRPVQEEEIKVRGALIEYAAEGTEGMKTSQRPRRLPRFTHAFCEACEAVRLFTEAPIDGGADLVCTNCGSVIATLYRGEVTSRPASAGAQPEGARMNEHENPTTSPEPAPPTEPVEPSAPAEPDSGNAS